MPSSRRGKKNAAQICEKLSDKLQISDVRIGLLNFTTEEDINSWNFLFVGKDENFVERNDQRVNKDFVSCEKFALHLANLIQLKAIASQHSFRFLLAPFPFNP